MTDTSGSNHDGDAGFEPGDGGAGASEGSADVEAGETSDAGGEAGDAEAGTTGWASGIYNGQNVPESTAFGVWRNRPVERVMEFAAGTTWAGIEGISPAYASTSFASIDVLTTTRGDDDATPPDPFIRRRVDPRTAPQSHSRPAP